MDDAARRREQAIQEAREELMAHWQLWNAKDVAMWWERWFGRTTHKGLVGVLRELATENPGKPN